MSYLSSVSTLAAPQAPATTLVRPRRRCSAEKRLSFRPLTLADADLIRPFFALAPARTCDFSMGGTMMWAQYFDYSFCIVDDTLFIKGVTEDDVTRPAFSLPVGRMSLEDSVALLRDYCAASGMELRFSAVPEQYVETLRSLGAAEVTALDDWSDYLYEASSLASLSGKKLGKKRNHVNRFMQENPGYTFEPITRKNLPAVKAFYHSLHLPLSKPALADIEREQVFEVLDHPDLYGFEGAVLSTPSDGIVAFTMGEVIGDTLFTHIEKMNHEVNGAGETVNKLFAEMMTTRHPELVYINREEDTGDPGLRHAKESYHPCALLRKFNVTM